MSDQEIIRLADCYVLEGSAPISSFTFSKRELVEFVRACIALEEEAKE